MDNFTLMQQDLEHIWHPCTQMKDHQTLPIIPIKSAKGVWLYDYDGNKYIDAISSWWVNLFGHSNEYINSKIKDQLESLEHVILAGFTHEPIVRLSQRLCKMTSLSKCFYADNGSSAIEVALKMSFHYHKNLGQTKPLYISLTNSYHGETFGALSIGDVGLYKDTYKEILIPSIQSSAPKDASIGAAQEASIELEKIFQKYSDKISAFIIEPLVQCAGFMKMHHPDFLKLTYKLCKKYDIHFIADEIAVGFGRTGTMFACEQADITPDFLVLSKGLTGGYLPLSVVLTNDKIYGAFYCDYLELKAFLHSHSYTGNALACVAANATLDLFENQNTIEKNKILSSKMGLELEKFRHLSSVKEVRQTGMIGVVELKGYSFEERVGLKIFKYCLKNGVLLRPLGNIVYFMPPYTINTEEIEQMFKAAFEAISLLESEVKISKPK